VASQLHRRAVELRQCSAVGSGAAGALMAG
jgi:hypothetical protein